MLTPNGKLFRDALGHGRGSQRTAEWRAGTVGEGLEGLASNLPRRASHIQVSDTDRERVKLRKDSISDSRSPLKQYYMVVQTPLNNTGNATKNLTAVAAAAVAKAKAAAAAAASAEAAASAATAAAAAATSTTTAAPSSDGMAAFALALIVLALVPFVIGVIFVANHPDKDVRFCTWQALNESISILLGVLIFSTFKDLMVIEFGETGGSHHDPPTMKSLIITFIRMLICFWLCQFVLLRYRVSAKKSKAWGMILGNVVGFAAIDSLGMIQQFSPFADSPPDAFLGMLLGSLLVLCMCISSHQVRMYWITFDTGRITEEEQKWYDQCADTENRFSAIVIGLLCSVVVRYAVCGEMPAIWGSPMKKTETQVLQLSFITVGLAFPVFSVTLVVNAVKKQQMDNPWVLRSFVVMQWIMSMTMGWCLLFAAQWQFWHATNDQGIGDGSEMTARLFTALIFSCIAFCCIIGIDRLADKIEEAKSGFKAVNDAFVLGLALSWQGVFSEVVDCVSAHAGSDDRIKAWCDVLMTICVCCMILPAWAKFILPKSFRGPEELDVEEATDEPDIVTEAFGEAFAAIAPSAAGVTAAVNPAGGHKTGPTVSGEAPRGQPIIPAGGGLDVQGSRNAQGEEQTSEGHETTSEDKAIHTPAVATSGRTSDGNASASSGKGGDKGAQQASGKGNTLLQPEEVSSDDQDDEIVTF